MVYHKVPYGTIRYLMVPYGTLWYHKVPRPGWGGTLLGREDILGFLTFEKKGLKLLEKKLFKKVENKLSSESKKLSKK